MNYIKMKNELQRDLTKYLYRFNSGFANRNFPHSIYWGFMFDTNTNIQKSTFNGLIRRIRQEGHICTLKNGKMYFIPLCTNDVFDINILLDKEVYNATETKRDIAEVIKKRRLDFIA